MVTEYRSLPRNAGAFAATMMASDINSAQNAIANGDTIRMIKLLKKLREYEN